ncbi:MAG: hypothetical protein E4G99_03235 [Anaerolineales bacterium]|nr:MAG: hypothetical protein E4G99_03235 [Anaerolineales bacterium]
MATGTSQIQCPNCGSPIQARVQQLIDVGQDPAAKSRLLSGSFNRAQCPVCGFDGAITTPLVYHDPEHELLLTYIPVGINISKDAQERLIGQMINRLMNDLPAEQRKAYLLQPQSVLTMQGLVERVLETEGITKEDIEAQQAKMRLFEELLRMPEDQLKSFIEKNDDAIDATFIQLMSITIQSTPDPGAQEAVSQRLAKILELSTFGQKLKAQETELRLATESLQALSQEGLTRESLMQLFIDAPTAERIVALTNLTRPALDYGFFQVLSERIDVTAGDENTRLNELRTQILDITQEIDKIQEARATQAASLLKAMIGADDLDQAIQQAIPLIDELFLGTLQANLRVARESHEDVLVARLEEIESRIEKLIRDSMPPSLQFIQSLLEVDTEDQAKALLESKGDQIDEDLLNSLMSNVQHLENSGEKESAEHLRRLYKHALKLSMRAKMG